LTYRIGLHTLRQWAKRPIPAFIKTHLMQGPTQSRHLAALAAKMSNFSNMVNIMQLWLLCQLKTQQKI
jgi:hypothetical protein